MQLEAWGALAGPVLPGAQTGLFQSSEGQGLVEEPRVSSSLSLLQSPSASPSSPQLLIAVQALKCSCLSPSLLPVCPPYLSVGR